MQLCLGAVQSHGLQKPILSNRNFHGCLENLLYNDLKLIDLAKQNSPQVTVVVSYCGLSFLEHHDGNSLSECISGTNGRLHRYDGLQWRSSYTNQ